MTRLIHRFILWLMIPVLGQLRDDTAKLSERIDGLISIHLKNADDVQAKFESVRTELRIVHRPPRLTFGTMMAWEAVVYSASKWDKDTHSQTVERKPEVILWARLFLSENDWPNPGDDMLSDLLAIRDSLKAKQLT